MATVVNQLVKQFRNWGVQHAFGVPGKAVVPIILELGNQGIEYVLSRHEAGAGYSAAGYALTTGSVGVAVGTSGPGGTNMITAAGQAKAYHLPVLFLTGHASTKETGKPIGQDSTFFGTDLVEMFQSVTLFSARVERGDQLEMYLRHAMERAMQGVRGPVHLAISFDVFLEQIPDIHVPLPDSKPQIVSSRLEEAMSLLSSARRPVLFLGKGVHISNAYEEVRQLAEHYQIPVITTPGGKGCFATTHPLHIGPFGLGGCPEARQYLASGVDVMVVIGTKLSDMSVPGIAGPLLPKRIVQFDVEPAFAGKGLPVETLYIQGDAKMNVSRMLQMTPVLAGGISSFQEVAVSVARWKPEPAAVEEPVLTAKEVMEVLGEELPRGGIIFGDDGSHSYHAIRHLAVREPGCFRFDDVFASMGHAIGYAVGAKIGDPNRPVVCLTGDGCLFMNGTEISTAVSEGANVVFVVLNNGRLDMVNKGMRNHVGRDDGTVFKQPVDAAMFADSMGAYSFKAFGKSEFRAMFREALSLNRTVVIDAMVDPEEIPPTMDRG